MSNTANTVPATDPPVNDRVSANTNDQQLPHTAGRQSQADKTKISVGGLTEDALSSVLDRHRNDSAFHEHLIELETLPDSITERLLRLVKSPALREQLIVKHSLSPDRGRDSLKFSRDRPEWWQSHILNAFR